MTDDVLCVRVSPNGRLLAAALLDSTVRVFFTDSLKFFLSLYGHKLPVLCMDISSGGSHQGGRAEGGVAGQGRREPPHILLPGAAVAAADRLAPFLPTLPHTQHSASLPFLHTLAHTHTPHHPLPPSIAQTPRCW